MGVLWTPYSPHNESNLPCSCPVLQCCVVWGGGEEPQVVLRQHQRHYLNITNGVYMLSVIGDSICDLHWEKKKIPTLLDHHHLHLYLHLLHYHIFSFKRNVHSTRGKQLLIVCSPYM